MKLVIVLAVTETLAEDNSVTDQRHTVIHSYYDERSYDIHITNTAAFDLDRVAIIFDLPFAALRPVLTSRNYLADLMVCEYRSALVQFYCELPSPNLFAAGMSAGFRIYFDNDLSRNQFRVTVYTFSPDGYLTTSSAFNIDIDENDYYPYSIHCFIATAAYGSSMASEVELLREFRDHHLVTTVAGRAIVKWYYAVSPPIASFIASRHWLRKLTRLFLAPVIWCIRFPVVLYVFLAGAVCLVFVRAGRGCNISHIVSNRSSQE